jgi:hypothetical protein
MSSRKTTLPLARLAAYGAAASAAATSTTSADIVYFNPTDLTTPSTGARFVYFTPSTGAVGASPQLDNTPYQFVLQGGTAGPPAFTRAALFRNANFAGPQTAVTLRTAGAGGYIARLAGGAGIGASGIFGESPNDLASVSGTAQYGNWTALGTGYFGFRFGLPDGQHFGWAQISILGDYRITLHDFAYESTPGASITAGAIPEPATSSLVALALGASGLAAYRARRKREQVAA